ncbi:MAG: hypothetical protein ACFBSG_13100 [Leptolyngbyaceae cyanobacterium]
MVAPHHLITAGKTVLVLSPLYAAGNRGKVVSPEPGSDRWLVEIVDQDYLLALSITDFIVTTLDALPEAA